MRLKHISGTFFYVASGVAVGLTLSAIVAAAWTGPTASPPNNNAAAPINVGTVDQVKNGGIGVDSLAVFGNTLFGGADGSNAYTNYGGTSGDSGYGFRDDNGVMEYKNSGGEWTPLSSGGSGTSSTSSTTQLQTIYMVPGTYTWDKPSSGTTVLAQCWGGGGGGGYSAGAGGGYVSSSIPLSQLPSAVAVTVAAGGSPGTYSTAGGTGGTSSFGSFAIAYGGTGGGAFGTAGYYVSGTGGTYHGTSGENGGNGGGYSAMCAGAGGGSEDSPGGASGCGGNGGYGVDSNANDVGAGPGIAPGGGAGALKDYGGGDRPTAYGARGECIVTVS